MNNSKSVIISALFLISAVATHAFAADNVRHVASRTPVIGISRELAAERTGVVNAQARADVVKPGANHWKLLATLSGAVIHDISFPTPKIGYAAAELGQVWKTTDAGAHWTMILNLHFPYYWFGVKALTGKNVAITGFNDTTGQGILRWSQDGGKTWTQDIILAATGWSYRIRFADPAHGLVMDGVEFNGDPNGAHYTTDGGASATDWTSDVPDPNGGWFGNQFSLLSNLHARASGITYCDSTDGGADWNCRPSIDGVFDGPTFFANDKHGWVGGGEISPNVEGWVHRTTNGGKSWSGRTLDGPWPIREIRFVSSKVGWAAGGNIYSNVGGMYFSGDGGKTWSLDKNTGAEMDACDSRRVGTDYEVWCAGYNTALNGVVYRTKVPITK